VRKTIPYILLIGIMFGFGWLLVTSGFLQRITRLMSNSPVLAYTEPVATATWTPPEPASTSTPIPTPTLQTGPWTNQLAPDFSLQTLSGDTVQLSDYRGKIILLNFWTSWCPPCKAEMPEIQSLYEAYQAQGLIVLGINITVLDDRVEVERFVKELGLSFPILLDESGDISNPLYRVIRIPTSYFIDQEGKIYSVQFGAMSTERIEQLIQDKLPD